MRRRDFIVGTLVRAGFKTSLKGFDQFCECVELYIDDRSETIEHIYGYTANSFGCTKSSVEKNIRRLFDDCDASVAVGRLFGAQTRDVGNKEVIAMFANYVEMSRDFYAANNA